MILLTLHLLSFPFEDDTKVNPYAGGDGEYRDTCPSSSHTASWTHPLRGCSLHLASLLLLPEWGRGKQQQPGLLQPPAQWEGAERGWELLGTHSQG